jgi:amyloid beta precursor protein binding protein 1
MSEQQYDADGKVIIKKSTQRNDRQLRLWGAHGQGALNNSRILCLGSGATASEILKNLVLPTVGFVSIVDDTKVTASDTGNNFFVRRSEVGNNRAVTVAKYLTVLNPRTFDADEKEWSGCHIVGIDKSPASLASSDDKTICTRVLGQDGEEGTGFDIVLDTCLGESDARCVAAKCWSANIPYVRVQVNGLLGLIRYAHAETTIVESKFAKTDGDIYDLFLHPDQVAAWPEYKEYLEGFVLEPEGVDKKEDKEARRVHKYIPYVAVLHQLYAKFLAQNEEGKKFYSGDVVRFLNTQRWNADEENFIEANMNVSRVMRAFQPHRLVQQVYQDPKASTLTPEGGLFWICVRAVRDFRAANNRLPVSNDLPDMQSFTQEYQNLKTIFKNRADADLADIHSRVQGFCESLSVAKDDAYVTRFVKNCRFIRAQRTTPIENEYLSETFNSKSIEDAIEDFDWSFDKEVRPQDFNWYYAFRAGEAFKRLHGRTAGTEESELENDVAALTQIGLQLKAEHKVSELDERVFYEFVRYAGTEPHNTASTVGGIASQVMLKALLHQFVIVDNTIVVNGIHGSVSTLSM